jgi:hypothetical protein
VGVASGGRIDSSTNSSKWLPRFPVTQFLSELVVPFSKLATLPVHSPFERAMVLLEDIVQILRPVCGDTGFGASLPSLFLR